MNFHNFSFYLSYLALKFCPTFHQEKSYRISRYSSDITFWEKPSPSQIQLVHSISHAAVIFCLQIHKVIVAFFSLVDTEILTKGTRLILHAHSRNTSDVKYWLNLFMSCSPSVYPGLVHSILTCFIDQVSLSLCYKSKNLNSEALYVDQVNIIKHQEPRFSHRSPTRYLLFFKLNYTT
jgi:hypothetical protein